MGREGKSEMGRSFQAELIARGKSKMSVTRGTMGCCRTGVGKLDLPEHYLFLEIKFYVKTVCPFTYILSMVAFLLQLWS